jgi:hypothetical protein
VIPKGSSPQYRNVRTKCVREAPDISAGPVTSVLPSFHQSLEANATMIHNDNGNVISCIT